MYSILFMTTILCSLSLATKLDSNLYKLFHHIQRSQAEEKFKPWGWVNLSHDSIRSILCFRENKQSLYYR